MSERLYLERLTDADRGLLAAASGEPVPREPELIEPLLGRPAVFDAIFRSEGPDPLLSASPFLVFAVLVQRVAQDLERLPFVEEWLGPGQRLPVFDVSGLREFMSPREHRLFLADLLASYTRIASGSVWVRTARGWRRRRYSELDPLRLAELLEVVPERERPGVVRRLGDLALFLAGVFPEHVTAHPLQPRHLARIVRLLDVSGPGELARTGNAGAVWVLEWLGRRCYELASRAVPLPAGVIEGLGRARRVLSLLTGRYLFPVRERWFPLS
jgi:hypothetical protein